MAEALLKHMGGSRFNVRSAGSRLAGYVHPLAIETLRRMNIPTDKLYSKSWNEFANEPNDIIITVCDSAASEPCPVWPGRPATAHWSLPDPSFHPGTEEERLAFAAGVANKLKGWFEQLLKLPLDELSPQQLKTELQRIGQT
jgi:arsenate reductase